jgi:hypothetical protein
MKARHVLSAAVVGVITLSGCLEVETRIDVSDSGTADVTATVLLDIDKVEELAKMFGASDELGEMSPDAIADEMFEGEDPCADVTFDVNPDDIVVEEIDQDGKVGFSCLVENVPLAELADPDSGEAMITQTDGVTEISLPFTADDLDLADSDELSMLGADFTDIFDIAFVVSAPGELVEHNATSTDGSAATWRVTPDAPFLAEGEMAARWEPGSSGSGGTLTIVLIVLGVAAIAIAAGVMVTKRRSAATTEPTAEQFPAPAGESFPPPAAETRPADDPDDRS